MLPLREAALAQLQAKNAKMLSDAANKLSVVGIVIAVIAGLVGAIQLGFQLCPL
jgi:hypothetical protein